MSLFDLNPTLANEWHPTMNGDLTPLNVTRGSSKRVWWLCSKGHEWQAIVSNRINGSGCPYCSGRAVCHDNCLQTVKPRLAKEWHPNKNGSLTPYDVTPGSHASVWWLCSKGHSWEAKILDRSYGTGCPYCAGKAVCQENCLQALNQKLANEWHPTKNNSLTPHDVTPNSNHKVWWVCNKGHEWAARVADRNRGKGCPYCAGKAVCRDNNLLTLNPTLAKEWHPIKNAILSPADITVSSHKKVWWLCKIGHEWIARVADRSKDSGCPYCSGNLVCDDNCLRKANPDLAKEWHPIKNEPLTPADITSNSSKKVWWRCKKEHEWLSTVAKRTNGRGCPYCAGKAVCRDNNLLTLNPSLAREWHPNRNDAGPSDVTPGSNKKVWWHCIKGHEWEATVHNRANGSGCPYCNSQTSQLELRLYTELKYLFGDVKHRMKIHGVECDIYIPYLLLAIELDGIYWHKDKYSKDKEKSEHLLRHDIILLRMREKGLKRISKSDTFFSSKENDFIIVRRMLNRILKLTHLPLVLKIKVAEYLRLGKIANDSEYSKLLDMLPSPLPGNSLADRNITVAKEWHPTKNGSLMPINVTQSSAKKVWWLCSKRHEWQSTVYNRNNGSGCPYCAGKRR